MRGNTANNINEQVRGENPTNGSSTSLDPSTNENTSVTLIRTGYNREAFANTFDTDFTELGVNEQDLS